MFLRLARACLQGEDWEEGFSTGLLNSLCIFPLLSYGATAPLAALPENRCAALIAEGWAEMPVGRPRLQGRDSDWEDNLLKEFLIAQVGCAISCWLASSGLALVRLGP